MSSGRRDQYNDRESKDQDSYFTNSKGENEKNKKGDYVNEQAVNGGYHSVSSERDSMRRKSRESGEFRLKSGTYLKPPEMENGNYIRTESKKRKITPIVWDREDKEVSISSKSRASPNIDLPPPPPFPKIYRKSSDYDSNGGVEISPVKDNNSRSLNHLLNKPLVDVSGLRIDILSPQEQNSDSYPENENQDYFPAVNILSSRWAGDADSPLDEGEIADNLDRRMRRKMKVSTLVETSRSNKSFTPECRELKREGLESRSTSLGANSSDDFENNEKELGKNVDSDTQSQTDSDEKSDKSFTPEPVAPLQRSVVMLEGCRSVDEYERLNRINEGTYGVVYRAKDKKTGEIVALKKIKMEKEREGFPLTALREINILLSFHHPLIVDVKEVVMGNNLDHIFMVMEYMEHDVKALMEVMKQPFSQSEVKCLMLQLLEGVKYLHDNWVLHRDLKTSNLLMNNQGELKICDFGLSRQYGSPLKPYTHLVVTLWYRAPELLLGQKEYSTAIDMWSLGCIMAELLSKEPLFTGKAEVDQLDKIFRLLGTPNEAVWPGFSKLPGVKASSFEYNQLRKKFRATTFTGSPVLSDAGLDLLNKLLTYDPEKRITADDALKHNWFGEVPLPKLKEFMPTFPAQNAQDRRFRKVMKSPDPLKEQLLKELKEREVGTGGLFG